MAKWVCGERVKTSLSTVGPQSDEEHAPALSSTNAEGAVPVLLPQDL